MGKVHFYSRDENGGLHDEGYIQADGKELSMYYFSFPVITDWNEDGLLDLLVHGKHNWKDTPNLILFINEGTREKYSFSKELQYKEDGGLGLPYMEPRIAPQVIDLDGDGKKDLVMGMNANQTYAGMDFYKNIGTNAAPELADPVPILDINGNGDWAPNAPGGKDVAECHPTFADWNGDGVLDIIMGGESGWNNLHISYGSKDDVALTKIREVKTQQMYKTSFKNGILTFINSCDMSLQFAVYNLSGRILHRKEVPAGLSGSVNLETAPGIGIIYVRSANGTVSTDMIHLR